MQAMGNRRRMTIPAPSGADDSALPATLATRPPMPSITASALLESWMLISRTRRTVADWLIRTTWTS
jgi:hypothetical protein